MLKITDDIFYFLVNFSINLCRLYSSNLTTYVVQLVIFSAIRYCQFTCTL